MTILVAIATAAVLVGDLSNLPMSDVIAPLVAMFAVSPLVTRWAEEANTGE